LIVIFLAVVYLKPDKYKNISSLNQLDEFDFPKCKEYYFGDEEECIYTGNVLKGNVAEDSIKSGLFTFKSDHPEVVSISKSGKLTAVSPGTATITIKCITKPKIKCSIKIKVQA